MSENNDQAQVKGIIVINDVGEATAQHARMMNPVIAKKGITIWQEAYPARPKVFPCSFTLSLFRFCAGNALPQLPPIAAGSVHHDAGVSH